MSFWDVLWDVLWPLIFETCRICEWTTAGDLARWLSMHRRSLVHRHLGPLVDAGILKYRYPETPNRRGQAGTEAVARTPEVPPRTDSPQPCRYGRPPARPARRASLGEQGLATFAGRPRMGGACVHHASGQPT